MLKFNKMMQVEAVIGSLSSTIRKTGLMKSPFSSSNTGSSGGGQHSTNKKHQRHSPPAVTLPTNGVAGDSDGEDLPSSAAYQKGKPLITFRYTLSTRHQNNFFVMQNQWNITADVFNSFRRSLIPPSSSPSPAIQQHIIVFGERRRYYWIQVQPFVN